MRVLAAAGLIARRAAVLTYPGRWPGVGLLLLRVTIGSTTAIKAWPAVLTAANTDLLGAIPAAVLGICGLALAIGLCTRACSAIAGLSYALVLLMPVEAARLPHFDGITAAVSLAVTAALSLLGPGAFSIDSRLFGRREIFIPAQGEPERR